MTDWWDEIEPERDADAAKAQRLARVIAKLPGNLAEKEKFLEQQMPLLEAEAERAGLDPEADRRKWNGTMKSLAFRYWRRWWNTGKGERPQQQRDMKKPTELRRLTFGDES